MGLNVEDLLRALVSLAGRQAFPGKALPKLVSPRPVGREKLMKAYNLCDGTRTQADVAKEAKVDRGQLSRTVRRWVEAGIMFRIGSGNESFLLHARTISEEDLSES